MTRINSTNFLAAFASSNSPSPDFNQVFHQEMVVKRLGWYPAPSCFTPPPQSLEHQEITHPAPRHPMQLMFFFGAFPPAPRVENHPIFPMKLLNQTSVMQGLAIYKNIYALLGSIVIPQTLHSYLIQTHQKNIPLK